MSARYTLRLIGAILVLAVAGSLLGTLVLFGLATMTAEPVVFLTGGAFSFLLTMTLGTRHLQARRERLAHDRRIVTLSAAVLAATMMLVFSATVLVPGGGRDPHGPPDVSGQQYWRSPSGSLLRVVALDARPAERATPVIFVHGGPGTPDMRGDSKYFGQLTAAGFDVYLYDEVGSGGSSRLSDPTEYTVDRDVTDLEAIRAHIGAQRVILIGHSYGATLAARYLATYPDHVSRVVFSSPGSLDPADHSGGELSSRLDSGQLAALYARLLRPRNLFVYGLLQVNPAAAHAFAGDAEMDAENDAVYAATEPGLHCDGISADHDRLPTGLGFYRLQYPQSATASAGIDVRPALSDIHTPALVIKGSCDYLSWASALTYTDTLPNAKLVYLRAGHNAYQDAPDNYRAAVLAFLNGDSIPSEISPTRSAPRDYQGPTG